MALGVPRSFWSNRGMKRLVGRAVGLRGQRGLGGCPPPPTPQETQGGEADEQAQDQERGRLGDGMGDVAVFVALPMPTTVLYVC
jgi:hypothetical protein